MSACTPTPASYRRASRKYVATPKPGPGCVELPRFRAVSNQLGFSSCVGNALADMVEHEIQARHGSCPELSRALAWHHGRLTAGQQHEDAGCYIGAATSNTEMLGLCREELWPYAMAMDPDHPRLSALIEASRNRPTFLEIHRSDIRHAILEGHPVLFGTQVGATFQRLKAGEIYGALDADRCGHAMVITGYDEHSYLVRNSWGTSWGDAGYGMVSRQFLEEYSYDLFITDKVDEYKIAFGTVE